MKNIKEKTKRRIAIAIASPLVLLAVLALGVIALPCEVMRVALINNAGSPAFVRMGNPLSERELWRGRVEPGEKREMSLATTPTRQFVEISVRFPDLHDRELTGFRENWALAYPLVVNTHRFDLRSAGIRSETIDGFWIDETYSRWTSRAVVLAQFLFVPLRCLDCEAAAWFKTNLLRAKPLSSFCHTEISELSQ